MDPKGKVALVTGGGASRVGGAITLGLGWAGADVVVHYRSSLDAAEEVAAEGRRLGPPRLSHVRGTQGCRAG